MVILPRANLFLFWSKTFLLETTRIQHERGRRRGGFIDWESWDANRANTWSHMLRGCKQILTSLSLHIPLIPFSTFHSDIDWKRMEHLMFRGGEQLFYIHTYSYTCKSDTFQNPQKIFNVWILFKSMCWNVWKQFIGVNICIMYLKATHGRVFKLDTLQASGRINKQGRFDV